VAVSPNGANVYITRNPGGAVYQYDVGPAGTLTPKTPSTVPGDSRRYATAVALGPPFAVVASGRGVICRQRTSRTEVNCEITVSVKSAAVAATATLVRHGRTAARLPATTGPRAVRVAVTPTMHVRPGSYTLSLTLSDRHHRRSNLRRLVRLR
jgi:hypothetical protein